MKSSRRSITSLLLRRLQNLTPFKPTTILQPRRTFCAKSPANANNGNVPETSVSSYQEQYKQLEKLDFMTATKMLFTALPSKIKFGGKKNVVTWATITSSSDSSKPSEKDHFGKQGSGNQDRLGKERVNGWHPVPYTSLKDKQGKIER